MLKFVCMSRRGLGKKRQNKREKKMIEQKQNRKKDWDISIDRHQVYLSRWTGERRTNGWMSLGRRSCGGLNEYK